MGNGLVRVLGVVRLGHHLVGGLVVGGNGLMLHDRYGHVRCLVVNRLVMDGGLVVDGSLMAGGNNVSSLVVNSGMLVEVGQMSSLVMAGSDSGVVSSGAVMGSSDVVRLCMSGDSGLVLNVDGVLDMVHGGVSWCLVMSGVRALDVVRLGHHLMGGCRHVRCFMVGSLMDDGVLVEVSQMTGLVDGGGNVVGLLVMDRSDNVARSLMVHRGDSLMMGRHRVMENRRVQMVRILMGNSLMVDWGSNVVGLLVMDWGSLVMDRGGNVVGLLMMDWGSNVVRCFSMLGLMMDRSDSMVDSHGRLVVRSLNIVHRSVVTRSFGVSVGGLVMRCLVMDGARMLSVVRLGHHFVSGLVVGSNGHVSHDRYGHVRCLVVN